MAMKEQDLVAIHTHACTAVTKADRTLTPDVDAFWLHYIPAALYAAGQIAAEQSVPLEISGNGWTIDKRGQYTSDRLVLGVSSDKDGREQQ
jgi:hypothetical protein